MEQYIKKSTLLAEIENLLDKSTYLEEYDCAYRDGNNGALYALKGKLDTLEVQEEPVSEDLEEVAKERVDAENYCYVDEGGMPLYDSGYLEYMFKEGAKWQKAQMMAKAINTKASLIMSVPSICISLPLGVNVGDKVKVIVIKED